MSFYISHRFGGDDSDPPPDALADLATGGSRDRRGRLREDRSEVAFARAFKRVMGVAPGSVKRAAAAAS